MISFNVKKIITFSFCTFVTLEINAAIQTGPASWGSNNLSQGSICISNIPPDDLITTSKFTCTIPVENPTNSNNGLTITTNHPVISSTNLFADTDIKKAIKIATITQTRIELGEGSNASKDGDVALGNNSKTDTVVATASSIVAGNTYNHAGQNPTNAVSVGDKNNERVIQNVASGQVSANSTDAVNGSQLYAAYDAINNIYQRQMAGYDAEISQINQNISDLKEGAYAAIAGALAIGNLPQPSAAGKNMISGGMGNYKGHSAAAFGFSSLSENEKVIWKMGASFDSNRNSGGAVSFGYQW